MDWRDIAFVDARSSWCICAPDKSTILRFRRMLEGHALTHAIFNAIADLLEERSLLLRSGTIVDATIIAAPSSTKNASAARDPGMKQTRKVGS